MGSKPVHGLRPDQLESTAAEMQAAQDALARAKREHMVSDSAGMKQLIAQMAAARQAIDAKHNALGGRAWCPAGLARSWPRCRMGILSGLPERHDLLAH